MIVSQYLRQIYLVVAHFDADYAKHIKTIDEPVLGDPPRMLPDMMVMSEYGPFNIGDAEDMKGLARHIVAYYCDIRRSRELEAPQVS